MKPVRWILWTLFWVIFSIPFLYLFGPTIGSPPNSIVGIIHLQHPHGCLSRGDLQQVGQAMRQYCDQFGQFPPYSGREYLSTLWDQHLMYADHKLEDYVANPALAGKPQSVYDAVSDPSRMSWIWLDKLGFPRAPQSCKGPSFKWSEWSDFSFSKPLPCRMVMFLDGHVEWMLDSELQRLLKPVPAGSGVSP